MKRILLLCLLAASIGYAHRGAADPWLLVNCAPNTPCTATGPINTHTGEPPYLSFYKLNTDVQQLSQMFGPASHLALSGSASAADITGLWTNCSGTDPVLGYLGTCIAGGGGGMVYPGAGIPVSTGTAWSTSITPGTGVDAALAVNTGSAGSFVVNGGALGTPSSGVATNLTGTAAGLSIGGTAANITATSNSTLTTLSALTSANGSTVPASAGTLLGTGATASMASGFALNYGSGDINANQLLGNTIPTLATGYLNWTGSAWAFTTPSGSPVTLQTNGTNNASQSTLNIESGTGVTVTNPSAGNVLITASASAPTFDQIGTGTNTICACVISSGASLDYSGTGSIDASKLAGQTPPASAAIVGTASDGHLVQTAASVNTTALAMLEDTTAITVSTCTPGASTLSPSSGTITQPATACTAATFTMAVTAPNGWICTMGDQTQENAGTYIPSWYQVSSTTTSCTVNIPAAARVASDVLWVKAEWR